MEVLMTTSQVMGVDLQLGGETYVDVLKNTAKELYDLNRGDINGSKYSSFTSSSIGRPHSYEFQTYHYNHCIIFIYLPE